MWQPRTVPVRRYLQNEWEMQSIAYEARQKKESQVRGKVGYMSRR